MASARRDRLIRTTLVIGALAAISTSAPAPHERKGRTTLTFAVGETHRATVRANEAAYGAAERFTITFAALQHSSPRPPQTTLRIVPDVEGIGTPQLLRVGDQPVCLDCPTGNPTDEDAGSEERPNAQAGSSVQPLGTVNRGSVSFDVPRDQCPSNRDCVIGFGIERIDRPGDDGIELTIEVTAVVTRSADPALICASDRDFANGAAVKVDPR